MIKPCKKKINKQIKVKNYYCRYCSTNNISVNAILKDFWNNDLVLVSISDNCNNCHRPLHGDILKHISNCIGGI